MLVDDLVKVAVQELLVILDHRACSVGLVSQVSPDNRDLLEALEQWEKQDLQDSMDQMDRLDLVASEVNLDFRDQLEQQDSKGHEAVTELLDQMDNEERRDDLVILVSVCMNSAVICFTVILTNS